MHRQIVWQKETVTISWILMTEPLQFQHITCPWCSEVMEISVDLTAGDQTYTEDCEVCCSPILLHIHLVDDQVSCTAQRE